jgi:hypothetical protein
MAQVVTAADVREYARTMETIDRAIEKRINEMPARGGRRVISEDQWRRELGQNGPRTYRHLPAEITVRSL